MNPFLIYLIGLYLGLAVYGYSQTRYGWSDNFGPFLALVFWPAALALILLVVALCIPLGIGEEIARWVERRKHPRDLHLGEDHR